MAAPSASSDQSILDKYFKIAEQATLVDYLHVKVMLLQAENEALHAKLVEDEAEHEEEVVMLNAKIKYFREKMEPVWCAESDFPVRFAQRWLPRLCLNIFELAKILILVDVNWDFLIARLKWTSSKHLRTITITSVSILRDTNP